MIAINGGTKGGTLIGTTKPGKIDKTSSTAFAGWAFLQEQSEAGRRAMDTPCQSRQEPAHCLV